MHSEIDRLRARADAREPGGPAPPCTAAFLGRVAASSGGATGGAFIKVNPWRTVLGAEAEGGAASSDVDAGASQLVYLLDGSGAVAAGDDLVCRFVPWRWVARKDGAGACGSLVEFNVSGCSYNQAGATVTLTKGGTTLSCTTVVAGTALVAGCTLAPTAAGTWNYSVSLPGYTTATGTVTVDCSSHYLVSVTLTPTGACPTDCCFNSSHPNIFLNDGFSTRTLTWDGGNGWYFINTITDLPVTIWNGACNTSGASGHVAVAYVVECFDDGSGVTVLRLRVQTQSMCTLTPLNPTGTRHFTATSGNAITTDTLGSLAGRFNPTAQACGPLTAKFSVSFPSYNPFSEIWPTATPGTFTLSS